MQGEPVIQRTHFDGKGGSVKSTDSQAIQRFDEDEFRAAHSANAPQRIVRFQTHVDFEQFIGCQQAASGAGIEQYRKFTAPAFIEFAPC